MLKQNNQKGFAAFEVILIVVSLVAVGVAGYFAYQARNATSASVPDKQVAKPQAAVDKYAGWKTYTSTYENFVFKYPQTWKLKEEANALTETPGSKQVSLTAPGGLTLGYMDELDGVGRGHNP